MMTAVKCEAEDVTRQDNHGPTIHHANYSISQ